MEANIEKFFLKLIEKHFPKTFKFHKIFNKNNVKVSYSCLIYFANMIKLHNNRILYEETAQGQHRCNCWQKDVGPLVGNCLGKELIHQCNLKENTASNEVNYNSLTENTFIKNWFYKHHNSLKCKSMVNFTELFKAFLGNENKRHQNPIMHSLVIDHSKTYKQVKKVQLTLIWGAVNYVIHAKMASKFRFDNKSKIVYKICSEAVLQRCSPRTMLCKHEADPQAGEQVVKPHAQVPISTKLLYNFIKITPMHGGTPGNPQQTWRTPLARRIPLGDCFCMSKES